MSVTPPMPDYDALVNDLRKFNSPYDDTMTLMKAAADAIEALRREAAQQELATQAQALDMGYGPTTPSEKP